MSFPRNVFRKSRATPAAQIFVLGVLISAALLAGCGYRPLLSGSPRSGSSGENTRDAAEPTRLAVLAIRNDSPEPWLDRILTDALRREADARGALMLVNDPSEAELVLGGRVLPLVTLSRSFSSFVAALEYSVTLALDLEVVRPDGQRIRLDPTMLSESDVYLASADIEITRTHRLEALRRLSDLLAGRVADSLELLERPIAVAGEGDP